MEHILGEKKEKCDTKWNDDSGILKILWVHWFKVGQALEVDLAFATKRTKENKNKKNRNKNKKKENIIGTVDTLEARSL